MTFRMLDFQLGKPYQEGTEKDFDQSWEWSCADVNWNKLCKVTEEGKCFPRRELLIGERLHICFVLGLFQDVPNTITSTETG